MKAIKYLVMGVLLTGFSTTAMAQELETKAAIDAIKNKSGNVTELVKVAQKKNKKNADALIAIARAFYEQGDTANARVNANLALEAGKQKFAPAYILLGDIEAVVAVIGGEDGTVAGLQAHPGVRSVEGTGVAVGAVDADDLAVVGVVVHGSCRFPVFVPGCCMEGQCRQEYEEKGPMGRSECHEVVLDGLSHDF